MKLRTVNAKIRALLGVGIAVVLTIAAANYLTTQLKDQNTRLANLSHNLKYWVVRSPLLETRFLAENDPELRKGVSEANAAIGEEENMAMMTGEDVDPNVLSVRYRAQDDRKPVADRQTNRARPRFSSIRKAATPPRHFRLLSPPKILFISLR